MAEIVKLENHHLVIAFSKMFSNNISNPICPSYNVTDSLPSKDGVSVTSF